MSSNGVPSTAAVLATLMRVTWRRLLRGRALWVSVVLAMLPVLLAAVLAGRDINLEPIQVVQFLVLTVLPPMFVASSLGEEIEERTTTYLWSRPMSRWTVVVGKLLALAPIAMVLIVGGWFLAVQVKTGEPPRPITLVAFGAGALAIATMSAGLATLVPRHGMALSIVYLVIIDLAIGAIPASIQNISITRQVTLIAEPGTELLRPAIMMLAIAGIWLAVALWRIRRLES